MYSNVAHYCSEVRIGNWFEDICREREKYQNFKSARDTGQLMVEKTRQLFDNFLGHVELEAPKDTISYGATIQLQPYYIPGFNDKNAVPPALSIIINERVVRSSPTINEFCEVTIAPSPKPYVRNSFRIVPADNFTTNSDLLHYGQKFRLECIGSQEKLYLYATPKAQDLSLQVQTNYKSYKRGELNMPIGIGRARDFGVGKLIPTVFADWHCRHIIPIERFETDGLPIPSNSPLVITHTTTNKNLAVENCVVQTLFGPEYLVSVQNYADNYKRENWQNAWMITNGYRFRAKQ
ncbi:cilia- and flagella-associated protein 161-like [Teleopsis dalmanni]|uniref:cilia- and flagella-associated protein 161-like n=1 Tax=Teleopsis dalmanni TaxID=139649 RepID=UPI0018CDF628|nr:cilia- and flagella-associated protein 161-like [Teleopsis dalmanni]XP_037951251.1 cilia- and flagella-associated protein 161-like [Teleopsis dalmanni]